MHWPEPNRDCLNNHTEARWHWAEKILKENSDYQNATRTDEMRFNHNVHYYSNFFFWFLRWEVGLLVAIIVEELLSGVDLHAFIHANKMPMLQHFCNITKNSSFVDSPKRTRNIILQRFLVTLFYQKMDNIFHEVNR